MFQDSSGVLIHLSCVIGRSDRLVSRVRAVGLPENTPDTFAQARVHTSWASFGWATSMGCDQKWSKQSRPGLSDQSFISCCNPLPTQLLRYFAESAVPNCHVKIKIPRSRSRGAVDDALKQRQERQAMTTFKATTEGSDRLGLRAMLER